MPNTRTDPEAVNAPSADSRRHLGRPTCGAGVLGSPRRCSSHCESRLHTREATCRTWLQSSVRLSVLNVKQIPSGSKIAKLRALGQIREAWGWLGGGWGSLYPRRRLLNPPRNGGLTACKTHHMSDGGDTFCTSRGSLHKECNDGAKRGRMVWELRLRDKWERRPSPVMGCSRVPGQPLIGLLDTGVRCKGIDEANEAQNGQACT